MPKLKHVSIVQEDGVVTIIPDVIEFATRNLPQLNIVVYRRVAYPEITIIRDVKTLLVRRRRTEA